MKTKHYGNWRKRTVKIVIVVVLISFTSCLSLTRFGLYTADPIFDELVKSMMDLPNGQVAIDGMPGMALMVTAMVSLSPENPKLLAMAAMAHGIWGWLIEDEQKEYAMELYTLGEYYGLRAVKALDDDIKEGIEEENKHLVDFLDEIDEDNMDIFFWYVLNIGLQMLGDSENPSRMIHIADVMEVMHKIKEIKPEFFFYAPELFDASFAAMGGGLMGIPLSKADKMFKDALAKTDNHMLLGYWMYARFYAVTIMDEKLFDETIDYVLETPNDSLPGGQLVNAIAKIKVKKLRENREQFF